MLNLLTRLFPLWALLLASMVWYLPASFSQGKGLILPLLMVIMFGMGMTLNAADFYRVMQRPRLIALGVALQYTVMPLLIAKIFKHIENKRKLLSVHPI